LKTKEKYYELKLENRDCLILIKSGNFYLAYQDEAYIMNLLFNYQIIKNRVGFPLSVVEKIRDELNNKTINYLIYNADNDLVTKTFDDNKYLLYLNDSKRREYKNSLKKLLFDRIEFLINDNEDNYDKIRRFIDEL